MKIVKLTAENVKRLKAVNITPDGALVQISGRNAQGKTSVLDSIEMVLGGGDHICSKPIRHGSDKAKIVCELDGGLVVKRTFTASGGGSLIVENKDGARFPSPQSILDKLIGKLTFDPLAFTRMQPKAQLETLKGLVGLDFAAIEQMRASLYAQRTECNRVAARLQTIADSMPHHTGVPEAEISISGLAQEFDRRSAANLKIEVAKQEIHKARDAMDQASRSQVEVSEAKARSFSDRDHQLGEADAELEAEIKRLREHYNLKKQRIAAACANAVATADQLVELRGKEISVLQKTAERLQSTAAAPPQDVDSIRAEIAAAEQKNRQIRDNQRRADATKQANAAKGAADELTASIEKLDADKSGALSNAKFPVDGLSFDESGVVFNGIPFDQASSAEQLRVSAAICFAMNPTLRVLLIRDGSLLDSEGMKTLAEIAEDRDAQIWIETVSDGSKVGVVIEDGCVVNQEAAEPATA